jgi:hypothetical protein
MTSPFTHDYRSGEPIRRQVKERVLARFEKPGHVAEIREREITLFKAIEWRVYIDDSMTESRMYQGARLKEYAVERLARRGYFVARTVGPKWKSR